MRPSDVYHTHPGIFGGTPVFTGTRVPVESLIEHLKGGETVEEFLATFPMVRRAQADTFLDIALQRALSETPNGRNRHPVDSRHDA
ncbi:hypothetical protein BH23BAC4_BH23BAC4_08740 [soil metagenome]